VAKYGAMDFLDQALVDRPARLAEGLVRDDRGAF
jgi:hypothetical protein